jgi:hypothetical protein
MLESITKAQAFLESTQLADGSWSYTFGVTQGYPEPTCYAVLALGEMETDHADLGISYLTSLVDNNGILTLPGDSEPNWGVSHFIITLTHFQQHDDLRQRSINGLLQWQSAVSDAKSQDRFLTLDDSLMGWPWIRNTIGWVEPTSYAIIALKKNGLLNHARVLEAEKLLLDRACPDGGWNVGNPIVLGRALEGFLPPTAIALLAMQNTDHQHEVIQKALNFLIDETKRVQSTLALAWGILCLDVYGLPTDEFVDLLLARQKKDGSWRQQIHLTALSCLALQVVNGGVNVFKI